MPRKCLMRLKKRSTRFRCRYRRTQSAACGWSATGCWSRHSCGRRLREWRCCRSLCRRAESRPQAELPAGPRSRGRAGSEGRPCPAREVANSEGARQRSPRRKLPAIADAFFCTFGKGLCQGIERTRRSDPERLSPYLPRAASRCCHFTTLRRIIADALFFRS